MINKNHPRIGSILDALTQTINWYNFKNQTIDNPFVPVSSVVNLDDNFASIRPQGGGGC